jgi:hypothetical protein
MFTAITASENACFVLKHDHAGKFLNGFLAVELKTIHYKKAKK